MEEELEGTSRNSQKFFLCIESELSAAQQPGRYTLSPKAPSPGGTSQKGAPKFGSPQIDRQIKKINKYMYICIYIYTYIDIDIDVDVDVDISHLLKPQLPGRSSCRRWSPWWSWFG